MNQGVTKLPRKELVVKKFYFDADTPTGISKQFQRHAYQMIEETSFTLVHYLGDESAAVDFCHRNATKLPSYVRTLPSKMKEFEKACAIDHANIVYKKEVASFNCSPERRCARGNSTKYEATEKYAIQRFRLSRDDLYNIHEIAYDISGFARKITTFPDLSCVCGLQVSVII